MIVQSTNCKRFFLSPSPFISSQTILDTSIISPREGIGHDSVRLMVV